MWIISLCWCCLHLSSLKNAVCSYGLQGSFCFAKQFRATIDEPPPTSRLFSWLRMSSFSRSDSPQHMLWKETLVKYLFCYQMLDMKKLKYERAVYLLKHGTDLKSNVLQYQSLNFEQTNQYKFLWFMKPINLFYTDCLHFFIFLYCHYKLLPFPALLCWALPWTLKSGLMLNSSSVCPESQS